MFLDVNKELPTADTRCRWVSPRTRWCDRIVVSGLSPANAMGSNAPAPLMTTITIKTTDDAIKFFELLRAGCNQRRIGVIRQGVVLADLQSLVDCQYSSLSLSLSLSSLSLSLSLSGIALV